MKNLPDVKFDIGEMYSGSVPIDKGNKSRELFFIFQPTIGEPVDEVTIWLNGGPGCSSLEGFFQENGRFTWQPGTLAPVENPYSWVNLTNMLWYVFLSYIVIQKITSPVSDAPRLGQGRSACRHGLRHRQADCNVAGGDRGRLYQVLQELSGDFRYQEL